MATDSCPDDDLFLAFKDGESIPDTARTHIETCAACQQRLSRLDAVIRSLREVVSEATILDDAGQTLRGASDSHATRVDGEAPAESPAVSLAEKFGDEGPGRFQLIRLLGKGAFGEVHLAYDPHLDRKVAIKVAQRGMLVGKSQVDRFQREAQAAAQLRHPNIIPVYDVAQAAGTNYIVYEYVEGQSLRAVLVFRRRLEPVEAATIAAKLAAALHYAHAHGIVHRDIKPDNILIDERGEPHIADFGLAYRDQAETLRTREGILMGTPAYMSPEQATGRGHDVDARADIWSLGVLLQEMLTGERPFEGPLNQILSSIQKGEPRPIKDGSIARDLQAICRTCLAKSASNRYQTAQQLADDLDRWRRGEPVLVRRIGLFAKTARWARRNPGVATLVAAVIAVLAAGLITSSHFAIQADREARRAAEQQRERALVQVAILRTATPESVPFIVDMLWPHRQAIRSRLARLLEEPGRGENEQVRMRLGLVAFADGQADHELLMQLFRDMTAAGPAEFLAIRDVLAPYADQLRGELWLQAMHAEEHPPEGRFRAACALAQYDPAASHWQSIANGTAAQLLVGDESDVVSWTEAVRPVREHLRAPLQQLFRNGEDQEQRFRAATALSKLFHDDRQLLTEQVCIAEPRQLRPLLAALRETADSASELARLAAGADEAGREAELRRANSAVALLELGEPERALGWLKQSPDMATRTRLVHLLAPAGIDPAQVASKLHAAVDPFVGSALVLSLGEYKSDRLDTTRREALLPELLRIYQNHPDPGVHSALDWLLRRWGHGDRVDRADRELASRGASEGRQWYINRQGNTMAILPGPVQFWMGSRQTELDRGPNENRYRAEIEQTFAISTKEITNRQYRKFREHLYDPSTGKYSPDPDCPVLFVSWYDAVRFCRWLSEQEGVPEDQMCFPPIAKIGPEMTADDIHLERGGYRLPTAVEWEYACRAGSETSRHFGDSEEYLPAYAWYSANSQNRSWPVGSLKPNGFGLFDMHANALEWCQNVFQESGGGNLVVEAAGSAERSQYELRGGTFLHAPAVARSAWRDYQVPSYPSYEFGLRVARTYNYNKD